MPADWPLVWCQPRETTSFGAGAAAFSPDGSQVALQADSRIARLLDTASGRELTRLTPAMSVSGSLAWSHSGRWLAMATENGTCLWDLPLPRTRLRELGLEAAF